MTERQFKQFVKTFRYFLQELLKIEPIEIYFFRAVRPFPFAEDWEEIRSLQDFKPKTDIIVDINFKLLDRRFHLIIHGYINSRGHFEYRFSEMPDVDIFPEDIDPEKKALKKDRIKKLTEWVHRAGSVILTMLQATYFIKMFKK